MKILLLYLSSVLFAVFTLDSAMVYYDDNCSINETILVWSNSGTIASRTSELGVYRPNATCTWLVKAFGTDRALSFTFTKLDVESCHLPSSVPYHLSMCTCDFVSIQDGNSSKSPVITKQCGKRIPADSFITSGSTAIVRFFTDADHEWRGFSLDFEAIDSDKKPCNGQTATVISGRKSGTIKSYTCTATNVYRSNEHCKWRIVVEPEHLIRLKFKLLKIQQCPECSCDSVTIYDGPSDIENAVFSNMITKRCGEGHARNMTYVTKTNYAFVVFRTDEDGEDAGFALDFQQETQEDNQPCENTGIALKNASGFIQNYKRSFDKKYRSNENCGWVIHAPEEDMFVRLKVLSFDIEPCEEDRTPTSLCPCDSLTIRDSKSLMKTICGNGNSTFPEPLVFEAANKLYVHFRSDYDVEDYGFMAYYETAYYEDLPCDADSVINIHNREVKSLRSPHRRSGIYRANENCGWRINGPQGYRLKIIVKVLDFDECYYPYYGRQKAACECDYLQIFDSTSIKFEKLIFENCGRLNCSGDGSGQNSSECQPIITSAEFAYIHFRTDGNPIKYGSGFELEITPVYTSDRVNQVEATTDLNNQTSSYDTTLVIAAIAALVCVVAFLIIGGIYWRVFKRNKELATMELSNSHYEHARYITPSNSFRSIVAEFGGEEMGEMMERLHIDPTCVTVGDQIGEGQFGVVYYGVLKRTDGTQEKLAIKAVKSPETTSVVAFLKEAFIMQNMDHPNVLRLIGVSVIDEQPFLMFAYMAKGSLRNYLRDYQGDVAPAMSFMFCIQICQGMNYLTRQKCVHRDLACRNVLVSDDGILKIADFGLARDLHEGSNYYWSTGNARPVPVRWHPPESILQRKFEEKSDVWSFGVVCWEIFNKCDGEPYQPLSNEEVIEFVCHHKGRLSRPPLCPPKMYDDVMMKCWNDNRSQRPSFNELLPFLQTLASVS